MVGPEAAEAIIRARGIMLPLPELKKIASSFLASTRTEIERLRIELAKKHGYSDDIDAATLEKPAAAHPVMVPNGLEDVLERYRAEEKGDDLYSQHSSSDSRRTKSRNYENAKLGADHSCRRDVTAAPLAGRHQKESGLSHAFRCLACGAQRALDSDHDGP